MCVYKMHTIASCLEFKTKKIQIFFLHFTTENWWFFGEKEIYTMGRIVPWGAALRAVWRTWKCSFFDVRSGKPINWKKWWFELMKKKKKNMKHEAMVLILWIFYRKRKSLINGCSHELKSIHIKIWIFPHEYLTKKTKFR